MQHMNEEYLDVEKILNRRLNNGHIEYKVKWLDFPANKNSWVMIDNMNCPELIRDFENSRLKAIIGATSNAIGLQYAIALKFPTEFVLMRSNEVMEMWPMELITYLENQIDFRMPQRPINSPNIVEMNPANAVGLPTRILACSDTAGESNYLCEWSPQTRKVVKAVDANEAFPHLVVSFLETNFDFLNGVAPTLNGLNGNVYLTRSIERWATGQNISFDPKVIIVRDMDLERFILNPNPPAARAAPINRRRNTSAAIAFKKYSNIPFGARGRKRRLNSIAYIGMQPNPDGRTLTTINTNNTASLDTPATTSLNGREDTTTNPNNAAPSGSAPSSSSNGHEDTIMDPNNTSPSTSSNAREDTTVDFDSIDKETMGRLNYSSDSD